jgi:hypothetical protein
MNVVFVQCCTSLTGLSLPPRDSGPILYIFQRICNGAKFAINLLVRKVGRQPNLLIWGGNRMILWLFSIVGVIVGVIATGTSITDPEAKILLGLALMGVVIRLQCGSGNRD